jgi:SAM-dependent methyltransferase
VSGWEDWRWDSTLFEGAAPHYRKGRLPYSPHLAQAVQDAAGLDGTGRLLDVGCGPGLVAELLAHLFDEVVGVDPDPGMIAEAERAEVPNARWVQARAEDLPAGLGTFRLVTFGASFHWMDRPKVAAIVRTMLAASGAVAQVGVRTEAPAQDIVEAVRLRYLGRDRRAGQTIRTTSPDGEDDVFQAAGFRPMLELAVPDGRQLERSIDEVVAGALSSSGTAPHLFGDRVADFEADLRAGLLAQEPSGHFSVRLADNQLRVWRPTG